MSEKLKYTVEDLFDNRLVMALAEGTPESRSGLDPAVVRKATQIALLELERLLMSAYDTGYLEAKLHCDSYHEGKNSMSDLGESYGYLNSYVSMNKRTIDARFQVKRPNSHGFMERKNIRHGADGGYSEIQLKKHAAHEYEAELAIMVEEHYARIRKQCKVIKAALRSLRKIEIFPKKTDQEK